MKPARTGIIEVSVISRVPCISDGVFGQPNPASKAVIQELIAVIANYPCNVHRINIEEKGVYEMRFCHVARSTIDCGGRRTG